MSKLRGMGAIQARAGTETWLALSDLEKRINALEGTTSTVIQNATTVLSDAPLSVRGDSSSTSYSRPRINFISGTNIVATVTDDSVDDEVDVAIATTGVTTGSGTTNYIAKWTGASALGNSTVTDDGTTVTVGASGGLSLSSVGIIKASGYADADGTWAVSISPQTALTSGVARGWFAVKDLSTVKFAIRSDGTMSLGGGTGGLIQLSATLPSTAYAMINATGSPTGAGGTILGLANATTGAYYASAKSTDASHINLFGGAFLGTLLNMTRAFTNTWGGGFRVTYTAGAGQNWTVTNAGGWKVFGTGGIGTGGTTTLGVSGNADSGWFGGYIENARSTGSRPAVINDYGLYINQQTVGSEINNGIFLASGTATYNAIAIRDQNSWIRSDAAASIHIGQNVQLGSAATDVITHTGRAKLRLLAADPLAGGGVAGTRQEIAVYADDAYLKVTGDGTDTNWSRLADTAYVSALVTPVFYTCTAIEDPPAQGSFVGTPVHGDLHTVGGTTLEIQEEAGAVGGDRPIEFTVTFGSVTGSISNIRIHGYYTGSAGGHQVDVQAYNNNSSAWDTLGSLSGGTTFEWKDYSLTNPSYYINGSNTVLVRFQHADTAGNTAHRLYLDYVGVVYAGPGAQVTDHGGLTGLTDDDHTQYLRTDGTRTLTGSMTFGDASTDVMTLTGRAQVRDLGAEPRSSDTAGTRGEIARYESTDRLYHKVLTSATDKGWVNIPGVLFTMTADGPTIVASAVTDPDGYEGLDPQSIVGSGVGSLTVPANFFVPGRTIKMRARGELGIDAAGEIITFRVYLGSVASPVEIHQTGIALTALTGVGFMLDVDFTCRAAGAATVASFLSTSNLAVEEYHNSGVPENRARVEVPTLDATEPDTTVANTIQLKVDWATADAQNTITLKFLSVEVLN